MAKKTSDKKVIARFSGQGFLINPDNRIRHTSKLIYLDRESYIQADLEDFANEMLACMGSGIERVLSSKRIKPGSLRITFQVLEK